VQTILISLRLQREIVGGGRASGWVERMKKEKKTKRQ
jgi:hypothetical protein